MSDSNDATRPAAELFPALLKHWRSRRGLSQLDLALAAGVSARHVSFLETGRSAPSAEMILRLGAALDVPLRHVDSMLQSAGHAPAYRGTAPGDALPDEVVEALTMMKDHHEPFPLIVIDRTYNVVDFNAGGSALFGKLLADVDEAPPTLNLLRLTFDPRLRERIVNFDEVGRALLWRVQREVLADPNHSELRETLDQVLAMSTVAEDWRELDLSELASPAVTVHLNVDGHRARFLTMVTALQAPQTVFLDELRIETWFPTDKDTAALCGHWVERTEGSQRPS